MRTGKSDSAPLDEKLFANYLLSTPIRQKSAQGQPEPKTSIERVCVRCRASFLGLAPGTTGERGLWQSWSWFCSQECLDG